jgi:hypothetical protein
MGEKLVVARVADLAQRRHGAIRVDGVPEDDRRGHQNQPRGAMALPFKAAVTDFAKPVEAYRPSQIAAGYWPTGMRTSTTMRKAPGNSTRRLSSGSIGGKQYRTGGGGSGHKSSALTSSFSVGQHVPDQQLKVMCIELTFFDPVRLRCREQK